MTLMDCRARDSTAMGGPLHWTARPILAANSATFYDPAVPVIATVRLVNSASSQPSALPRSGNTSRRIVMVTSQAQNGCSGSVQRSKIGPLDKYLVGDTESP